MDSNYSHGDFDEKEDFEWDLPQGAPLTIDEINEVTAEIRLA